MTNATNEASRKTASIIGLLSETYVHVGVGQSNEALDLPVARERTSHYPFVPGSGVKGAMRVWSLEHLGEPETNKLFGDEAAPGAADDGAATTAGLLLWSDARLLLLPVRSTTRSYRLVTCQDLINRLRRDRARAGLLANPPVADPVASGRCLCDGTERWVGLEEREFERTGAADVKVAEDLSSVTTGSFDLPELKSRLVQLNNDDFAWFARYALPVMARNRLSADKIVETGALWNEEAVAPNTTFYLLLSERKPDNVAKVVGKIRSEPAARYVQMGGNETVGQGWLRMSLVGGA